MSDKIWKIKEFRFYIVAIAVSYFGSGMQFISVSWIIMKNTNSVEKVGLLISLSTIPAIILSLASGVVADKFNRKYIAVIIDLTRFLIVIIVPIFAWISYTPLWLLYVVEILLAALLTFYWPAVISLVKEIIPKNQLIKANSIKESVLQIAVLVGTGVSGLLLIYISPYNVILINGITFLISGICISFIRYTPQRDRITNKSNFIKDFRINIQEGFQYIMKKRQILILIIVSIFPALSVNIINVLLSGFVKNILNKGPDAYGFIDSGYALGAILGGVLLSVITVNNKYKYILVATLSGLAMSIYIFSLSWNVLSAFICYIIIGAMIIISKTICNTFIQNFSDNSLLGRVQSFKYFFLSLLSPIITYFSGVYSEKIGIKFVLNVYALFLLLVSLYYLIYVIRKNLKKQVASIVEREE